MLLTNRQEISAYFTVLCWPFSVRAMNKYCTVAVCRNGSKTRSQLFSMIVTSRKVYAREKQKIQETNRFKNLLVTF